MYKCLDYYIFCGHKLARRAEPFKCEWLVNGEWQEDRMSSVALEDSLHDYGDFSLGDQDQITEIMAIELIQNGTIVLQGDIGYGTTYYIPKTVQLSHWKKPKKSY